MYSAVHMTNKPVEVFLPRDAMLARYMLSSCVRLSVNLSVFNHTPVLY